MRFALCQKVQTTLLAMLVPGGVKNTWIENNTGSLYVRIGSRLAPNGQRVATIDFSNIAVRDRFRQRGLCRGLLKTVERVALDTQHVVFVETVLNPILADALTRYGYQVDPRSDPTGPCFWKASDPVWN